MKKGQVLIGVAALVITAATLLIFGNTIGRYFSKEHRVDNYLRRYGINSNVGIIPYVTSDYSKPMNDRVANSPDPDTHRNAYYEILMPTSCRSEILSIYNRLHGSNHDVLPIDKDNFINYEIYLTSLLSIYGIDMTETLYTPAGKTLGIPAEVEAFTLFARKGDDEPALAYIVVRKIQDGSINVLPIDMKQTEFVAYFNALRADFIEFRTAGRN